MSALWRVTSRLVESNGHRPAFQVERADDTGVTIEYAVLVVIPELHDLVAHPKAS